MITTLRSVGCFAVFALIPSAAFAAEKDYGGGFIGGLRYSLNDPVTHTAALALAIFLFIVWRAGAFKMVAGQLDDRAERIKAEIDEAKRLRAEAEDALKAAEAKRRDADELADQIKQQAKRDADRLVSQSKAELDAKLARRRAQAEARVARAEAEAIAEVRQATTDAAIAAAGVLLKGRDQNDRFDRAVADIEKKLVTAV